MAYHPYKDVNEVINPFKALYSFSESTFSVHILLNFMQFLDDYYIPAYRINMSNEEIVENIIMNNNEYRDC